MPTHPTIYDVCDNAILHCPNPTEPGKTLRSLYRQAVHHPALRWFVLRWCRHPEISGAQVPRLQRMFHAAMGAGYSQWRDREWILQT